MQLLGNNCTPAMAPLTRVQAQLLEEAKAVLLSAARAMQHRAPVAVPLLMRARPAALGKDEPLVLSELRRLPVREGTPLVDTAAAVPAVLLDPPLEGRGNPGQ